MEKEYLRKLDLKIDPSVYQKTKKCPFCHSVFINKSWCESCGRNLEFNLLGEPFSSKSYYFLKEEYIKTFYFLYRLFPNFENIKSAECLDYQKKLFKRFKNLVDSFDSPNIMSTSDRPLFYFETKNIIAELIYCHFPKEEIVEHLCSHPDNFINQELLNFVLNSQFDVHQTVYQAIFKKKLIWKLNAEDFIAISIILSTLAYAALKLKLLFS